MMALQPEPIFFGAKGSALFGWIHAPRTGAHSGLGLVICNPYGYEEICAHRSLRELAQLAAASGIPAIRFDYAATGDSTDDAAVEDQVPAWLTSIRQAMDELRSRTGVLRFVLAGVRLGATLGAHVAVENESVIGWAAMAPVVNPRTYLRELRALEAAIGRPSNLATTDGLDSAGFTLSGQTCKSLLNLGLPVEGWRLDLRAFVLDRDELSSGEQWISQLRENGVPVTYGVTSEYHPMMTSPHGSVAPHKSLRCMVDWIMGLPGYLPLECNSPPATGLASTTILTASTEIREEAAYIDREGLLFAIVSTPAPDDSAGRNAHPRRGTLLLNAGATHHIGPSRLNVILARRLAAEGQVSMRLDQAGIGDSQTPPGRGENDVYSPLVTQDIAQAVEHLHSAYDVKEVVVIGLCSGAYHAMKAACAGVPIRQVIPINPLTFFWKEGMSMDAEFPAERVVRDAERYRKGLFRLEAWRKLLRGDVRMGDVLQVASRRLAATIAESFRDFARGLGIPLQDDLPSELALLTGQGIRVSFVFAEGEPGLEILRMQGGTTLKRLLREGRISIGTVTGGNHTFTPRLARERLVDRLLSLS